METSINNKGNFTVSKPRRVEKEKGKATVEVTVVASSSASTKEERKIEVRKQTSTSFSSSAYSDTPKRDCSYHQKTGDKFCLFTLAIAVIIIVLGVDTAFGCETHRDCPRDQICDSQSENKVCRCPAGFLLWKWTCVPSVPLLNGFCSVTEQCRQTKDIHRHCSPIIKQCICDFGYQPVRNECLAISNPTMATTEHQTLMNKIVSQLNKTIQQNYADGTNTSIHHANGRSLENDDSSTFLGLDEDKLHTLIYIGLALMFVLCVGTISTVFMRSWKEQRKNEAAFRGFLDIMSGGGSNSSAGRYGWDRTGADGSELSVSESLSFDHSHHTVVPGLDDSRVVAEISKAAKNKIILPPLEDGVCFPDPQKSAPILPSIRNPRQVRHRNSEDIRFSIPRPQSNGQIASPSLSAISKNLTELNRNTLDLRPLESAASFPSSPSMENDNSKTDEEKKDSILAELDPLEQKESDSTPKNNDTGDDAISSSPSHNEK